MKRDLKVDTQKVNTKGINYIKKYSIRLKIFKALAIMFLLVVLIFAINIDRKMIIVTSLINKEPDTSNCHFIRKMYNFERNLYLDIESFSKDNIVKVEFNSYDEKSSSYLNQIDYKNETEQFSISKYWDNENQTLSKSGISKNTTLLSDTTGINIYPLRFENIGEYFDFVFNSNITSIEYEGKECYFIIRKDGVELIVEKSTGFIFRAINRKQNHMTYSNYSLGTVTDEDMQRPDTTGYKIMEY